MPLHPYPCHSARFHHIFTTMTLAFTLTSSLVAETDISYPVHVTTKTQQKAWRIGWPNLHGPYHNGQAMDCGIELVRNFEDAKHLWSSDAVIPPSSKHQTKRKVRSGYCTPVLSMGKIYVFWTLPSGWTLDDCNTKPKSESIPAIADEYVLCIDALSGKTIWQRKFEASGKTTHGSGKAGGHYTMSIHQGKAYAFGSGGRIYCLDANTGTTLWQSHNHPKVHSPNCVPQIASGILVYREGNTLYGYDANDGNRRWMLNGVASGGRGSAMTRVWQYQDQAYFIHESILIDPRNGKKCWDIGPTKGGNTTIVHGDLMITAGGTMNGELHGPRAFRISPKAATFLWSLSPELETKPYSSHVISQGHVYMDLRTKVKDKDTGDYWRFQIVDTSDGNLKKEIVGLYKGWRYQPILAEGLYIYAAGYNCMIIDGDPHSGRVLSNTTIKDGARDCSPAYACGLLFIRSNRGMQCWDLRTSNARQPGPSHQQR